MSRLIALSVALTVGVCIGRAEPDKPVSNPNQPSPNEVEVRFSDGSVVRMLLLQDSIEVATRFGKLKVPVNEIQKIEFGVHMPEGLGKKIDDAIKRLGSDTFKEREVAANELVAIGVHAYFPVQKALKNSDAEVARNADAVLHRIKEKVPADQLNVRPYDTVQTGEFTMAGTVETPLLKARSAYFGDMQLKVTDLRAMRWLAAGAGETEVVVDAGKFGGNDEQWMETGITLTADAQLKIAASGQVDLRAQDAPGRFLATPAGNRSFNRGDAGHPPGALMGRIGESGTPFVIGEKFEGKTSEGKLYLRIMPGPFDNRATGAFKVKVNVGF